MRNALAHAQREVLMQYAWSRVLLAFDYDGTLAPIVSDPARAVMRPATRRLLVALTRRYPCCVISGRSQADAARLLKGIPLQEIIGNHGLEPWDARQRFREQVEGWRPRLSQRLAQFRGVRIEDKVFSIAVHYRHSRQKRLARSAIVAAAGTLGEVRTIGGKQVINILPLGAPHKGIALERERARLGCDTAIYVGDDETDEDVFGLDQPGRLLSIRVGARRQSLAPFYVPNQAAVDDLLEVLIGLREPRSVP
jgi:trehalose 6-phosphate phosphatase